MEFVIRRKDYDRVQAKAEGLVPVYGSFNDFFGEIKGYLNRNSYVNNMEYKNHTLYIEKYDFIRGFLFTDSYVLDGLLESDSRFMEGLSDLLLFYDSKKDILKANIESVRNKRGVENMAGSCARKMLEEYCITGDFTLPSDSEVLAEVCEMYKNMSSDIFSYTTCNMEGDYYRVPSVKLSIPQIKTLKALTGVAGVSSICCAAATITACSPVAFAGCIASGVGAYYANKTKNEINEKILKVKALEIASILEEKCSSDGESTKVYMKDKK